MTSHQREDSRCLVTSLEARGIQVARCREALPDTLSRLEANTEE